MRRRHSVPPEVYAFVEQTPGTVLLEGGAGHATDNTQNHEEPWTQLFTAPFRVYAVYEPAGIPGLFAAIEEAVATGLSAAGFFSYECGACFEPKARMRRRPEDPLAWIGLYERSYTFDHATGEFQNRNLREIELLRKPKQSAGIANAEIEAEFALSPAEYAKRIAAIHEWIRAGDVYQLNFTAPWRIRTGLGAAELYARLRARQPVPYGAFVHWQSGRQILSFSPELFFRVDVESGERRIVARPMKGTVQRGRTTAEDKANAEWLRNDKKNRSENLMIVDLVRNDLGRLSQFGSVQTEKLFSTERYPTLWQMTSTVSGVLRPEIGFEQIFRALFPCGSITGAPKVRAMQLIAEIETAPRGIYTGAIGFFSRQQTIFNVAIRTLDIKGQAGAKEIDGAMGAGSGIVIDSDAEAEYREVLLKAEFLRSSLRGAVKSPLPDRFSLIESLRWDGGYPLMALHLDRLVDSADYFDFPCERNAVKKALEEYARRFDSDAARKVRLLLDCYGELRISDEVLRETTGDHTGRVRISEQRTNSRDAMLFHKTTHRALYSDEFTKAAAAGFDDVLFLNERDEVTEGAISNIFVEKDGHWMTPPIECGLLAGVYRRYLLETRPEIEERVLHLDDLRAADAVYLANAVRGLKKITIARKN